MHWFTEIVLVLGTSAAAIALIISAAELQRIRTIFQSGTIRVTLRRWDTSSSARPGMPTESSGYAIFTFRGGQWRLEADLSQPGYEAVPPNISGTFEGQVIKKISGPKN